MEEILQCPRCVDLAAAEKKAISATDFQLIMNAETTDWSCQKGHVIKGSEVEAIMTEMAAVPALTEKVKTAARRAARQAGNSRAREESTPVKVPEKGGQAGGAEVPAGGNDQKQETEAAAPVVNILSDEGMERAIDQITDLMEAADVCADVQVTRESVSGLLEVGVKVENGNLVVAVEIPEQYVQAAETLAAENNQSVREWAQQRMEFYLESEFGMVKTV